MKIIKEQKGQALPMVLILLVLGSLLIIPTLNYGYTSLKGHQVTEIKALGLYAADAGVENALWKLKYTEEGPPSADSLEDVNNMNVTIETDETGHYVLYFGEFIEEDSPQSDWLVVDGDLEWDGEAGAYKYTITITWQSGGNKIHLLEVGARLPLGCSYQDGSAALFDDNICTGDEPYLEREYDADGAQMVNWNLTAPYPDVFLKKGETRTQQFYVIGTPEDDDDYGWAVAHVSETYYSEISGYLYVITATAKLNEPDEDTKAQVLAYVIHEDGGDIHILSWQITK